MKKLLFLIVGSLIFSTVVAEKINYLDARNGKMIKVPKPLDDSKISNYFVIKNTQVQPGKTPLPPGSTLERRMLNRPYDTPGLPSQAVQYKDVHGEPALYVNQKTLPAYKSVRVGLAKQNITVVKAQTHQNHIAIYDTFSTYDRIREDTPIYDIVLKRAGKKTMVRIRDENGARINPKTSRRLLLSLAEGMRGVRANDGFIQWLKNRNGTFKYG